MDHNSGQDIHEIASSIEPRTEEQPISVKTSQEDRSVSTEMVPGLNEGERIK